MQVLSNARAAKSFLTRLVYLGELSLPRLIWQTTQRVTDHETLGRAAQLSYYFLLALFPLLVFLSSLLGVLLRSRQAAFLELLAYLGFFMPGPAFQLVKETMNEISAASGGKLSLSLSLSIWIASSGTTAVIEGLNSAYGVSEKRSWWRRRCVALYLTVILAGLVGAALLLLISTSSAGALLGVYLPFIASLHVVGEATRWLITFVCLLVALTILYRYAPNVRDPGWEGILPGAGLALAGWLVSSKVFGWYLLWSGSLNRNYGSLGAVVALLLWLYVSGAAILIGGEMNAVIRDTAAKARPQFRQPPDRQGR